MKRDWDLIREILVSLRERDTPRPQGVEPNEYWTQERMHHLRLLSNAGLVEGFEFDQGLGTTDIGFTIMSKPGLTWHGHDFVESILDDTVWSKTKEKTAGVAGGLTFAIVTQIATHYLKEKLGINQ